jgi:polyketide cyclase/dehydrase/lipid transport protein
MTAMGQVTSTAERVVDAPAADVRAALADDEKVRPQILTEQFSEYRVESGGRGAGTGVRWKLAATKRRPRDCLVDVVEAVDGSLVERDANSSMVTTWLVEPEEAGRSRVRSTTTWKGAGGVGGVFERIFAPKGLGRIYEGVLANLDRVVRG